LKFYTKGYCGFDRVYCGDLVIRILKQLFCIFLRFRRIYINFGSLCEFPEYLTNKRKSEKDLKITGPKVATSRLAHRAAQPAGISAWPRCFWAGFPGLEGLAQRGARGQDGHGDEHDCNLADPALPAARCCAATTKRRRGTGRARFGVSRPWVLTE
jgi:hypothetical protein